jgi:phospholipid-binding lipoprotein MlaA
MKRSSLITLLATLLCLSACDSSPPQPLDPPRRQFTNPAEKATADAQFAVYDPAQGANKQVYKFNAELDRYLFIPVVNAYTYVTPDFFRTGVQNFFLNVGEVTNFTNAVFQAKPAKAGVTLGRFAINTTVGLLGTFDVASDWGIARQPEDFGETLGYWGMDSGAYVVLPLLGPSNVRDTFGKAVDYATMYFVVPSDVRDSVPYDVIAYGLQPVNERYSNSFRYYSSGSPFEYELVRYVVTQVRTAQIDTQKKECALCIVHPLPHAAQ